LTNVPPVDRPEWATWREAVRVVADAAQLKKSITIAVVIGSLFVGINQLPVLISGHGSALDFVKVGLTYMTPFAVSNYSVLLATRARELAATRVPYRRHQATSRSRHAISSVPHAEQRASR
jgi:hypothetical protein